MFYYLMSSLHVLLKTDGNIPSTF